MVFSVRMAINIYNKLKKIAYEEERSINGEVCYIIRKYIEEKETQELNKKETIKNDSH